MNGGLNYFKIKWRKRFQAAPGETLQDTFAGIVLKEYRCLATSRYG